MNEGRRLGVWIAGARGNIAITCRAGAAALGRGLIGEQGLVTALAPFADLGLAPPGALVFGGADPNPSASSEVAERLLYRGSRTLSREVLDAVAADLDAADADILNVPASGEEPPLAVRAETLGAALSAFRARHRLDQVVVFNLTPVEPDPVADPGLDHLASLEALIEADRRDAVTTGILYAYAALRAGCAYINFTPNAGTRIGAIQELAAGQGLPFYGDDGKTGETLVKAALAPLFASRNLRVLSWEGINLLGNADGEALRVPANRAGKLRSKSGVLGPILGYEPAGRVRIDYTPSLGDWKTAWDLIHFEGFLGVPMSMQFTWQGCDSVLAAPLVLDMARLAGLALERGESGPLTHLAMFFKSPLGVDEMALWPQFERLLAYAHARH